jgi:NADH-quinone oxidoreductase subunit M
MPWFSSFFLLVSLSSIAVPGFKRVRREFLILMGSWGGDRALTGSWSVPLTVAASTGVVLAAAYMLWMVQRVFYGEVTDPHNEGLPDLSARESVVLTPLLVLALVMGIASPLFTRSIEPTVDALVRGVREHLRQPSPVVAVDARPETAR